MSFSKEITGFRFSSKQFVCTACKEPVFKVSRNLGGKTLDHFPHYSKDETLNEQVELRVSRISAARIAEARKESRNQKQE